jgi:hypothetical protein
MFLYAKLVLEYLEARPDIKTIKQELIYLPDVLERGYVLYTQLFRIYILKFSLIERIIRTDGSIVGMVEFLKELKRCVHNNNRNA